MTKTFKANGFDPAEVMAAYQADGYFVLQNVFGADEVEALRAEDPDQAAKIFGELFKQSQD